MIESANNERPLTLRCLTCFHTMMHDRDAYWWCMNLECSQYGFMILALSGRERRVVGRAR